MVYLREAPALDGRSPLGGGGMPIVEDPVTLDERNQVAKVCMSKLALEPIPALVDDMDDAVGKAYAAHPDRLYLVGRHTGVLGITTIKLPTHTAHRSGDDLSGFKLAAGRLLELSAVLLVFVMTLLLRQIRQELRSEKPRS